MWLDAVSELTGGQVGMFVAAYAIVADQSDERSQTLLVSAGALYAVDTSMYCSITILQITL